MLTTILVDRTSVRLSYVLDFLREYVFIDKLVVLSDPREYILTEGAKIQYSENPIQTEQIRIHKDDFLYEVNPPVSYPSYSKIGNEPGLFRGQSQNADIDFDLFASLFFCLAGCDDYIDTSRDKWGRRSACNAFAYTKGFLEIPVVDGWISMLKVKLSKKFPGIRLKESVPSFELTIDVDHPWAFKYRPRLKVLAGGIRDIMRGNFRAFQARISHLMQNEKDPYDQFDRIQAMAREFQIPVKYFFLMSDYAFPDNNEQLNTQAFKELVSDLAGNYIVGIHPSIRSNFNQAALKKEIDCFQYLTAEKPHISRQHYLADDSAQRYRRLIEHGIDSDYSKGYFDHSGFRSGTTRAHYWFDLERNEATNLLIFPFKRNGYQPQKSSRIYTFASIGIFE